MPLLVQVMRMGSPVTSLSLSPAGDLLATTHTQQRGVFLWSNQMMFGDPTQIAAFTGRPVDVGLPTITTGHARLAGPGGEGGEGDSDASSSERYWRGSGSSSDDGGGSSSDSEVASSGGGEGGGAAQGAGAAAAHERTDAAGAPLPLTPSLVTLSLLPRTQWENLMHLEVIKARSKPVAPPKKPEAAPFFLPTVPTLAGQPVFDTTAAAAAGAAAAGGAGGAAGQQQQKKKQSMPGWDSEEEDGGEGEPEVGSQPASRVVRSLAGAHGAGGDGGAAHAAAAVASPFLRLLRAGADAGDYTSFMALLRGLSPAALDRELRALTLLGGQTEGEVDDLEALLACLDCELAAHRNFEFCAALTQHILALHGEEVLAQPRLQAAAARLRTRMASSWGRMSDLLQSVRCMVEFYGNIQL